MEPATNTEVVPATPKAVFKRGQMIGGLLNGQGFVGRCLSDDGEMVMAVVLMYDGQQGSLTNRFKKQFVFRDSTGSGQFGVSAGSENSSIGNVVCGLQSDFSPA